MLFFPLVLRRADRTGGRIAFDEALDLAEHSFGFVPVQLPSPPALVRFRVNPPKICSFVIFVVSVVRVGTI
jgi:hypothetical protein